MKFVINKDNLIIEEKDKPNSGSVKYYEIDVEYDDSWEGLTIKAVLVKSGLETGKSIALVNNKVYIDNDISGTYEIGFVGYTIEGQQKVYQISTNLKAVKFNKGAGQIETEEQTLPTPTEWEIYIAQMEEITSEINGLADDLTAQVNEVEIKLENGDFDGADGYTPVRGTDYWTPQDVAYMEQYCADYIDANITQAIGGSY